MMKEDIAYVLYSQEALQEKVKELGALITEEYAGKSPFLIGVLKAVSSSWPICAAVSICRAT